MKHIGKTIEMFWKRWRAEYLLELREAHRNSKPAKGVSNLISIGDIVIVHNENHPRGLWKLGKIEELICGANGNARGAVVRVCSGERHSIVLRRPVQWLFLLEVKATTSSVASDNSAPSRDRTSVIWS